MTVYSEGPFRQWVAVGWPEAVALGDWVVLSAATIQDSALQHFSTFAAFADPAASSSGEQEVETVGYLLDGDRIIDDDDDYVGQANPDGGFDWYDDHTLLALTNGTSLTGIVVLDETGAELWRETSLSASLLTKPVIVGATVVWGDFADDSPGDRLLLQRRALADGAALSTTTIALLSDFTDGLSITWEAIGPIRNHSELAIAFRWTRAGFDTFQEVRRVSADGGTIHAQTTSAVDGRLLWAFVRSTDELIYGTQSGGDVHAFDEDLARVSAKDFALSGLSNAPTVSAGGSGEIDMIVIANDACYWSIQGVAWLNIADRAGTLLRSILGRTYATIDVSVQGDVQKLALRQGTPEFTSLLRGQPIINNMNNDIRQSDNSPYTRAISLASNNAGGDAPTTAELLSSPAGSSLIGTSVSWPFTEAADPPVIAALADASHDEGVFFERQVFCTPSEIHGDTGDWEVTASNVNGDGNTQTWQTTIRTNITFSMIEAPSGVFMFKGSDETAFIQWSAGNVVAGVHTFTIRATSHVGFDEESFELTVT